MPTPYEILREFTQEALRKSGGGARRFERDHGLPQFSLRGILDAKRPQIPSVDRAAEICPAIGLELYVGPPRTRVDIERVAQALSQPATASIDDLILIIDAICKSDNLARDIEQVARDLERALDRLASVKARIPF